MSDTEWAAARRTTINAHFTDLRIAAAMWSAVAEAGFTGGRILEPGCGSGNFIRTCPEGINAAWVGVELDPITAAIAQHLHPKADIRREGFETSRLPPDHFDLVIGNVPFGKVALHDPIHNPRRESIHNHFIIKALHLTRPGAVCAVVTSRYTMDARMPSARRSISELADLVGAVRLPSAAHRSTAGTDVVTDILILRRREVDRETPNTGAWIDTSTINVDGASISVNDWFTSHPNYVLGALANGGIYRGDDLKIVGSLDHEILRTLLVQQVWEARSRGLGWVPPASKATSPADPLAGIDVAGLKEGAIVGVGQQFARKRDGQLEKFSVSKADARELSDLLALRDTLNTLLDVQASDGSDEAYSDLQRQLNHSYDAYRRAHGPLNRFKWGRTGRTDPESGEEVFRRLRPKMGGFRDDPDAPSVFALETFDLETGTAAKAAVFTQRLLRPRTRRTTASTAGDALAIVLDESATVDIPAVAALLGVEADEARAALGVLVFDNPEDGGLVTAAEYLSGNVRAKLRMAVAAAEIDNRFRPNVRALEQVQPVDLLPEEITVRPGQTWLPPEVVSLFVQEVLGADRPPKVVFEPCTATWEIDVSRFQRSGVSMTSEWGTPRADAVMLLRAAANNSPVTIYDVGDDGKRLVNQPDTLDAREKQAAIVERFANWVWEGSDRSRQLAGIYNERFNSHRTPLFEGSHLTFPGLVDSFVPRPHQRDAVARILGTPTALLAHEVGAGKTATMIMAATELKRLGLVEKPMVVVPNHMLEQFTREWKALYPRARVLFPSESESGPDGRKGFVARAAVGDWDAVVVTMSVFERIPLSVGMEADLLERKLVSWRTALDRFRSEAGGDKRGVKDMERKLLAWEQRHTELMARRDKDDGATFEMLGVDYLFVDEAHLAKNLTVVTRQTDLRKDGSGYATQLEARLTWLRDRYGDKVATFATATPVANSLSEMFVMQTYLRPDHLADAGVEHFDSWAANFAETVTRLELAPEGTHYRVQTRMSKFRNVPELISMFHQFADVRTKADLDLPVPALKGGRAEVVVVPGSDELRRLVTELGDRAERVRSRRVTPEEDNMLKISSDGRAAALDLRLVGGEPDPQENKLTAAANRIAQIYRRDADRIYLDEKGAPHPRPGSLQLVFAQLGTPGGWNEWSLYEQLRSEVVKRGVPRERVRFIHEARTPREKTELFSACRDGRIAVLLGTTEKMGIGTNIQQRCVALHHLDCPWRPSDIEQREGRILRQGNRNASVEILRYVTEGSFDTYMWQTVERKSGFIHQVLKGRSDRLIDDVAGDSELSYAEVKALSTGDGRILRKAGLENDVGRLRRQRSAHYSDQARLQQSVVRESKRADEAAEQAAVLAHLVPQIADTRGDAFVAVVNGKLLRQRGAAGERLVVALTALPTGRDVRAEVELGGVSLQVIRDGAQEPWVSCTVKGTKVGFSLAADDWARSDPSRLMQRLERTVAALPVALTDAHEIVRSSRDEATQARARLGKPFPHERELKDKAAQLAALDAELLAPEEEPSAETRSGPTERLRSFPAGASSYGPSIQ